MIYKLEDRVLFDGALGIDAVDLFTEDSQSANTPSEADSYLVDLDSNNFQDRMKNIYEEFAASHEYNPSASTNGTKIVFSGEIIKEPVSGVIFFGDFDSNAANGYELKIVLEETLQFSQSISLNGNLDDDGDAEIILDGGWVDHAAAGIKDQFWQDGEGGQRIIHTKQNIDLSNIILQHGSANGTSESDKNGGAVYSTKELTAFNVSFVDNTAIGNGGAIYSKGSSASLTLNDSLFTGNSATNGGALYVIDSAALNNKPALSMVNSTLHANIAEKGGGLSVYLDHNAFGAELDHVTIAGNMATKGSGDGIYLYRGSLMLRDSIIADYDDTGTQSDHTAFYNYNRDGYKGKVVSDSGWGTHNLIESQDGKNDASLFDDSSAYHNLIGTPTASLPVVIDPQLSIPDSTGTMRPDEDSIIRGQASDGANIGADHRPIANIEHKNTVALHYSVPHIAIDNQTPNTQTLGYPATAIPNSIADIILAPYESSRDNTESAMSFLVDLPQLFDTGDQLPIIQHVVIDTPPPQPAVQKYPDRLDNEQRNLSHDIFSHRLQLEIPTPQQLEFDESTEDDIDDELQEKLLQKNKLNSEILKLPNVQRDGITHLLDDRHIVDTPQWLNNVFKSPIQKSLSTFLNQKYC